jgi:hypothetical protein
LEAGDCEAWHATLDREAEAGTAAVSWPAAVEGTTVREGAFGAFRLGSVGRYGYPV